MVNVVRWSARSRSLPGSEVDQEFETRADEAHLFSFVTDRMTVGPHGGPFSVKWVLSGREEYRIGRRTVAVTPGQVLVVNADEEYASCVEEPSTHSVSLFLPMPYLHGTLEDEDPRVFQVPFRPSGPLAEALTRLTHIVTRVGPPDPTAVEESVVQLAAHAASGARSLAPPDSFSGCARPTTRESLLERVLRARDLIHDRKGRVSLDLMAREAGLSRYHFLRAFKEVFGRTPAQYAAGVRLDLGRESLARGDTPKVAAKAAGYASSSAFLRALRRYDA